MLRAGAGAISQNQSSGRPVRGRDDHSCRCQGIQELTCWYRLQYHCWVPSVVKIVAAMRENPRNIRYADLAKVCAHYFGSPRTSGGSHAVYKTPWPGDPRVNIQDDHGAARAYQVRQVLAAIEKKEGTT